MNVYVKALVLFALVCAPIVFLYTFYRRVNFEFPPTDSGKIVAGCRLLPNKDSVNILNSIENLNWENMLIPIMSPGDAASYGPRDVNVFRARIDANKTPVPGNLVRSEYIKYLEYVTTVRLNDSSAAYSGSSRFVQSDRVFQPAAPGDGRSTAVVSESHFVMIRGDGSRARLRCFIPALLSVVSVCLGRVGQFFPVNDTQHTNHLMSNPMFNIDDRFGEFKFRYYRKWRDDGYAKCATQDRAVFHRCPQPRGADTVSVYTGAGRCVDTQKIKYECERARQIGGHNYLKFSDTEYMDCNDNRIVKCKQGTVFPTPVSHNTTCVQPDSANF